MALLGRCYAAGCQKPGTKPCSRCHIARYCGRECQLADWARRHKHGCGASAAKAALELEASKGKLKAAKATKAAPPVGATWIVRGATPRSRRCLLYTSDAADE